MKATYQDFLENNKNCSGLTDNKDAQDVFDILSKDENIIEMIEYTNLHKPALMPCVKDLIKWHENKTKNTFPFKGNGKTENFNKRAVGNMVKTILEPFGYEVDSRKAIPKEIGKDYFTSASTYCISKEKPAKLIIKKVIIPIEK